MINTIDFLGLPLVTNDPHHAADWLTSVISREKKQTLIVSHINANNYFHLSKDTYFRQQLENNALLLFDGIALKLAAQYLGLGWLPDLNGTDLFPLVMTRLVDKNIPLYFLGADESVVASVVQSLQKRWPAVKIVGYHSGYFTENDEDEIVENINASGAKVLFVGRGFGLQEKFSLRHKSRLKVSLIWNVGGLFDFISGRKARAPLWMRQMGLEWLFRLLREPKRLWCRTFIVGPWLASHVLTLSIQNFFRDGVKSREQLQKKEV